jgi:hypothetical protein
MSLTLDGSRITLVINSTFVDDDAVRRIQALLDDPDVFPLQVSTTTVFQEIPTTVSVIVMQTSIVTATVTVVRPITVVPTATFQATQSRNQIASATPASSNPISTDPLLPTTTPFLSSSPSVPDLSPLDSPAKTTIFSSNASTSPPSTASTTPTTSVGHPSGFSNPPPTGKKGLPAGAVIGIVLSCLVLFLFLGIYFVRWRLKGKRARRRGWITPFVAEKPAVRASVTQRQQKRIEFITERWQRMRNSRRNRGGVSAALGRGNDGASRQEDREANPVPAPPSTYREPSTRNPVQDSLVTSTFPNGAVAKFKFEPSKRDELYVRPGDYLKVLTMYGDGWSLCKNGSGEKGMVPTNCLRANGAGRMAQS